jgi:fructokinase
MMMDVLCIGELLVEFVADTSNVSLSRVPGFIKAPGGAPANVAVALSRLGLRSGFMGKVGNDPFGDYLRDCLEADDVDTAMLYTDENARTTAVFTAVWDDGRKDLCFYRNPGADMLLRSDEIDPKPFADLRCFHFGSITLIDEPSRAAQLKAIELARENGSMISYDPNYRPTLWPNEEHARTVIQDAYKYSHLAKISEEEWEVATGHNDFEAGVKAVLAKGVELLVISKGENGSLATNGEYLIQAPPLAVDVVETTGAGDGFLATVIAELLPERERLGSLARISEQKVAETLKLANAVGACACTKPGAIPALPTRAEVEQFINTRET